jgi:hypothetical protein
MKALRLPRQKSLHLFDRISIMKIIRTLFLTTPFLLLYSCLTQRQLKMPAFYNGTKYVHKLAIPFEHKTVKWQNRNAELMEKFSEARMSDGSVVYITNDKQSGGGVSDYKIERYGNSYSFNYYLFNDTASLAGSHNGKYWKEIKYYNIVVGYYNVSPEMRTEYDKILNGIIPQAENMRRLVNEPR